MTQARTLLKDWRVWTGASVVTGLGLFAANQLSQPELTQAEMDAISNILVTRSMDPAYQGDDVCESYRTKIAYLSECAGMFENGVTGPCPARDAPTGIDIPSSADGLTQKIAGLERLKDEGCKAPLLRSNLLTEIGDEP